MPLKWSFTVAREIVKGDLGARLDRVVAGAIGGVVLDDPRLFIVVLNEAIGAEENLLPSGARRVPV